MQDRRAQDRYGVYFINGGMQCRTEGMWERRETKNGGSRK